MEGLSLWWAFGLERLRGSEEVPWNAMLAGKKSEDDLLCLGDLLGKAQQTTRKGFCPPLPTLTLS